MSFSNSIASGPGSLLQNLTMLHNDFQKFDTPEQVASAKADNMVSEDDLKAVMADGGKAGRFNKADVQAAQFFLDHPDAFARVDTAAVSDKEPGAHESADDKSGQLDVQAALRDARDFDGSMTFGTQHHDGDIAEADGLFGALGANGAGSALFNALRTGGNSRTEALSAIDTLKSASLLTDKALAMAKFSTPATSQDDVSLVLAMPKQGDGPAWTPENEGQVQTYIQDALARHGGNVAEAFADLRDRRQKPENYYDSNMAIAADYLRARWDVQRHGTAAEQVAVGSYLALKRAGGVPQEGPGPVSPYSDLEAKYMWKGVDDESRHQSFWDDLKWSVPVPLPLPLPLPLGFAKAGAETLLNFL